MVPPVLDVLTRRPDSGGLPHLLALKSNKNLQYSIKLSPPHIGRIVQELFSMKSTSILYKLKGTCGGDKIF